MPRKTSQASKKETTEAKSDGVPPRRSGRAMIKQESSIGKDASRSRRSSTAAQTAASVADSRSPKGRSSVSTRRESTSPPNSRTRGGREGLESPATRVKSTRRSTSRINYKESDGEEEAPAPKYDENFDSGDEFDESESDEKSKPRGKSKPLKAAAKGRRSKEKTGRSTRGRRGRPSKKMAEDEEESKTFDVSDDSIEPEVVATKQVNVNIKEKEISRSRGRRQKAEVVEDSPESKQKSSRRSSRSASNKEEIQKKRPSRSVQAKRYTEDEDEIEDVEDSKAEDEMEEKGEAEGTRKRKRESSPDESNKRVKETENQLEKEIEKNVNEAKVETKDSNAEIEMPVEEKSCVEPMEVDEFDSGVVSQDDCKIQGEGEISEIIENEKESMVVKEEEKKEIIFQPKEKLTECNKTNVDISENIHDSDSQAELSISSETEDSQKSKEFEKEVYDQKSEIREPVKLKRDDNPSQPSELLNITSEESKQTSPIVTTEIHSESGKITNNVENNDEFKKSEVHGNDTSVSKENELISPVILKTSTDNSPGPTINTHSAEKNPDPTLNGQENIKDIVIPAPASQISTVNIEHKDISVPKANGAREVIHSNSSFIDQHCLLAGRKYVVNSNLKENILQSVKNQTFGFLSYNLGSDMCVQKEKLLNELHKLNSHIICLQQVPKPFYSAVLEPSLDALGYKSVFCQPEDSLKGMATFYKNSLFRLSSQSVASLKQLIDKELEASSLDHTSRAAVKSHIKRCGNVIFTHFASVIGTQTVVVANVQIPPSDLSTHALQVSCLAREVIRINGGTNNPLLIGGEFNIFENDASYQLLRDGYLSNDMIDELQRRKDIAVPEKENSSLVDLLWKSFQHPSSNLCSCYTSVLDHELIIPELKTASPDLLWYSSGSLHTVGVLDVGSDKLGDRHISLKADIAFVV